MLSGKFGTGESVRDIYMLIWLLLLGNCIFEVLSLILCGHVCVGIYVFMCVFCHPVCNHELMCEGHLSWAVAAVCFVDQCYIVVTLKVTVVQGAYCIRSSSCPNGQFMILSFFKKSTF